MTADQKQAVGSFLDSADVDTLHRTYREAHTAYYIDRRHYDGAAELSEYAPLFPPYYGPKALADDPDANADYCAAVLHWLADLGVPNFDFREDEDQGKQLRRVIQQLSGGAGSRLADLERPFRVMVDEIHREQAKQERAAARRAFRETYGTTCVSCNTTKTKLIHPFLDVLCCDACQRNGGDEFKLIYKTTAKKDFGVTDVDLKSLPCLEVVNRHYRGGPPARLFLLSAVKAIVCNLRKAS